MKLSIRAAEDILKQNFAPWVQELNIEFGTLKDGTAILRSPSSPHLNRVGGTVCGQAIMALADTAMVFAIATFSGELVPLTTVNQTSSFLRPAADATLVAEARVIKRGRVILYGEVNLHTGLLDKPVAHVTSTYMLI